MIETKKIEKQEDLDLNDIFEMENIVHYLARNCSIDELKDSKFDERLIDIVIIAKQEYGYGD